MNNEKQGTRPDAKKITINQKQKHLTKYELEY